MATRTPTNIMEAIEQAYRDAVLDNMEPRPMGVRSPYETRPDISTYCRLPGRHMELARCQHVACLEGNEAQRAEADALLASEGAAR